MFAVDDNGEVVEPVPGSELITGAVLLLANGITGDNTCLLLSARNTIDRVRLAVQLSAGPKVKDRPAFIRWLLSTQSGAERMDKHGPRRPRPATPAAGPRMTFGQAAALGRQVSPIVGRRFAVVPAPPVDPAADALAQFSRLSPAEQAARWERLADERRDSPPALAVIHKARSGVIPVAPALALQLIAAAPAASLPA